MASVQRRQTGRRQQLQDQRQTPRPQWLQLHSVSPPKYLYRVVYAGSGTASDQGLQPYSPLHYTPSDDHFREITRRHLNWIDTDETWWVSTFENKQHALYWAEVWRIKHPRHWCAIHEIDTGRFGSKIFNAAKLIRHFNIPLKVGLRMQQFEDEYLVLNDVPRNALCVSRVLTTNGEFVAAHRGTLSLSDPRLLNLNSPASWPVWRSYNVSYVPEKLYRVMMPRGKAAYTPDGGIAAYSDLHPDAMSDAEFIHALCLHVNGDTDVINDDFFNMFTVFSNRAQAMSCARVLANRSPEAAIDVLHIDGNTLATMTNPLVYHAAYVVQDLNIPLEPRLQISDFTHQYLILHQVPCDAITKTEEVVSTLRPRRTTEGNVTSMTRLTEQLLVLGFVDVVED